MDYRAHNSYIYIAIDLLQKTIDSTLTYLATKEFKYLTEHANYVFHSVIHIVQTFCVVNKYMNAMQTLPFDNLQLRL